MNKFVIWERKFLLARFEYAFFATATFCAHEKADLSLGTLTSNILAFPLHQAKFVLSSGKVVEGPNDEAASSINLLRTIQTKVDGVDFSVDS